ncbi:MAG TPA: hypothetical protein VE090_04490 [Methylomirabilota bacterium]|nr:hypothetical protein [Methylomirabilota bacterium]
MSSYERQRPHHEGQERQKIETKAQKIAKNFAQGVDAIFDLYPKDTSSEPLTQGLNIDFLNLRDDKKQNFFELSRIINPASGKTEGHELVLATLAPGSDNVNMQFFEPDLEGIVRLLKDYHDPNYLKNMKRHNEAIAMEIEMGLNKLPAENEQIEDALNKAKDAKPGYW